MGCDIPIGTNIEYYESSLQTKFYKLKINEVNLKFEEFQPLLERIENIRNFLINERDLLIFKSGNCCSTHPCFSGILFSFLIFLSSESNGDIQKYQIYFNTGQPPYFSISNAKEKSDSQILSEEINKYIEKLIETKCELSKIKTEYRKATSDLSLNYNMYKSLLNNSDIEEMNKFDENCKIIRKIAGTQLLEKLEGICNEDYNYLDKFPDDLENKEFMNKVKEIGKNNFDNGYSSQYEITFFGLDEGNRYGFSPKDGKYFYEDKLKARNIEIE